MNLSVIPPHSSLKHALSSDPKVIGPGTWFVIHKMAIDATTREKCLQYIDMVLIIVRDFPCGDCSRHGLKFIKTHPPENYIDIFNQKGNRIGMFEWSRVFHNTTNKALNKPILTFDEAWNLYDESVCQEGCG